MKEISKKREDAGGHPGKGESSSRTEGLKGTEEQIWDIHADFSRRSGEDTRD